MNQNKNINVKDKNPSSGDIKGNINGTDIVLCFDTTGSMQPAIKDVRDKIKELIAIIAADIPNYRIGIISHGDYCDGQHCLLWKDLTNNVEELIKFINDAPNTGGGDSEECYEYALHIATKMSWSKKGGSIIMFGDDYPHEVNPHNLDWRKECKTLNSKNVKVFPVQCLFKSYRDKVNGFWKSLSSIFETPLLQMNDFEDTSGNFEGVLYTSAGPTQFKKFLNKYNTEVSLGIRKYSSDLACSLNALSEYSSKSNTLEIK